MYRKMTSILIIFFIFSLTNCYDWCRVIAPDGNYRELSITRKWKSDDEYDYELVMYNRVGDEWLFTFPQSISTEATIKMVEGSVRAGPPPKVTNRFAIYADTSSSPPITANFQLINEVLLDFVKPIIDLNLFSVEWLSY